MGVQVAKTGAIPKEDSLLAGPGERGIRKDLLPAGMHFINPYEFDIIQVDIRSYKYDMVQQDAVGFPSKDGFEITIDITIEWRIDRNRVAEVIASIGEEKYITGTIIRPNARSISRTEGSKYSAKDFIIGSGREEFQSTFFNKMAEVSRAKGIENHRALVRKISVPQAIAAPIKATVISVEEDLRNKQGIKTAKSAAELAREEALATQNKRRVEGDFKSIF